MMKCEMKKCTCMAERTFSDLLKNGKKDRAMEFASGCEDDMAKNMRTLNPACRKGRRVVSTLQTATSNLFSDL